MLHFELKKEETSLETLHLTLDELKERNLIQEIDCHAARVLSKGVIHSNVTLLLAYLFSASRQGHLCVEINSHLCPALKQVWFSEVEALTDEEEKRLSEEIIKAFKEVDPSFFRKSNSLVVEGSLLYLQKNWVYEREIWDAFKHWEQSTPELKVETPQLKRELSQEQQDAVQLALSSSLSFITGGPGVGKTYTASYLLSYFLSVFPKARIALVAPTGKAVANLHGNFLKLLKDDSQISEIGVFTLHKLFSQKIYSYLPYDLILVDETSMINTAFMHKLLHYAKPCSRLIFLGDPNQLPPIESGFIFQDLLQVSHFKSQLTKCIRSEHQSLIDAANCVKEERVDDFINYLNNSSLLFSIEKKEKEKFYNQVAHELLGSRQRLSPIELIESFQKYKILSPLRKGPFGVDRINQELKTIFSDEQIHPIMVCANDYRLQLFNGDIGVLYKQKYAYFPARSQEESYYNEELGVRRIPFSLLPRHELAYCVSVHKSQGSEYKKVALVLPPTSEVFGLEMLYTGLTRAKKSFEVFSDLNTLQKIFRCKAMRHSGIQAGRINEQE